MRTAAALIIGNELLSGKIADANLVVLARALRSIGIRLSRAVMVLDELDVIAHEVRVLSSSHDWLFTSGGVGPTHDDLTIDGIAHAFGVPVVTAPLMDRMLRAYYGDRVTEGHLRMARVPEGARLASDDRVPWPTVVMRNVWMLPGVPEIFLAKIPLIRSELGGDRPFVSFAVYTMLDEGQLKPMLDAVVAAYQDVDIGSYPKWNDPAYRTKLTFDSLDAERAQAAREQFIASLPDGSIVRIE